MKDSGKNQELPYLKYWDINNPYGQAMMQKLPVNDFKWVEDLSEFDEGFIKSYNEKGKGGYFIKVDIQYPKHLHNAQINLLFLPERLKIEKVEKLVANLHDNNKYIIHIRTKIWRKSNIMLPGYRQFHHLHKNRLYL